MNKILDHNINFLDHAVRTHYSVKINNDKKLTVSFHWIPISPHCKTTHLNDIFAYIN